MVSKHRRARIKAIAKYIVDKEIDIVGFQEIWIREDYILLSAELNFPYSYYFRSGIIGSGLAVFSKYPITEVSIKRFSSNGKPQRLHHGDWLGGKAVGLCRIKLPDGVMIDFYNTHLHAAYVSDVTKDEYLAHRISQIWELVQFIRHTRRNNVILVGDLNFSSDNVGYLLLTANPAVGGISLLDTYTETKNVPEKLREMKEFLLTETTLESTAWKDALDGISSQAPSNSFSLGNLEYSERIDYTFYYANSGFQLDFMSLALLGRVPITETSNCSFSDHYGVLCSFSIVAHQIPAIIATAPTSPTLQPQIVSEFNATDSLDSPLIKSHQLPSSNVDETEMIYSITKILTWGIMDALNRHKWHVYGMVFFTIVDVSLIVVASLFNYGWLSVICALLVIPLCYNILMSQFVIPEEVSSLERVRSEILIQVQGNITLLHPAIPIQLIKLLSKPQKPVAPIETPERRNSMLDPGPSTLIRTESAVLLSGISNAILGSQDHPPSQLF